MESPETEAPLDESAVETEKPKLALEVDIDKKSACSRHITVTIPREDIDRYFTDAFDELQPKAEVPGFRPGRAPRRLVESKFRDRMSDQVKGSLLMDSVAQVTEDSDFSAISEPDFDFEAIDLPNEGPLKFEFNIEVRPEFDIPDWKGLKVERPVHEYTDEEIETYTKRLLKRYATPEPKPGPIEAEDRIAFTLTIKDGDTTVASHNVPLIEVNKKLSFQDANLDGFADAVMGKSVGDRGTCKVTISEEAENEELRGKELDAEIMIDSVVGLKFPELTPTFLDEIGGFEDVEELNTAVREELDRQMGHRQQRRIREQITDILLADADWDLPPDLLRSQARRELDRMVLELRAAGYGDDVIRGHQNQIQQNSLSSTARSLKEHFMLERIAEEEGLDADPADFDAEVRAIATQRQESTRRVRARLEKRGQMDAVRNQIIERKVVEMIAEEADITDTPLARPEEETTAVDLAVTGEKRADEEIPEAKYAGESAEERPGKA